MGQMAEQLFRAMQLGMMMKRQRLAEERRERQEQDQQKYKQDLITAMEKARTGDFNLLYKLDPKTASSMETQDKKRKMSWNQYELELNKQKDEKTRILAANLQRAIGAGDQQKANLLARVWNKQAQNGIVNPPPTDLNNIQMDPEQVLYGTGAGAGAMAGALGAPGLQGVAAGAIEGTMPAAQGLGVAENRQQAIDQVMAMTEPTETELNGLEYALQRSNLSPEEQQRIRNEYARSFADKNKGIKIYTGEISKTAATELQKESAEAIKALPVVNKLLAEGDKWLGWGAAGARGYRWVMNNLGQASEEDKQKLIDYKTFHANAMILANKVAKSIEKGRMSDEDRKFYLDTLGISKNSAPAELIAGLQVIKKMAEQNISTNDELLANGLPTMRKAPTGYKRGSGAKKNIDAATRFKQIRKTMAPDGRPLTPQQKKKIQRIMEKEGYGKN